MKRTRRQSNITPETLAFLENEGPKLLSAFAQRCENGRTSMRGNNYETERDYSWRSAEQRKYNDRMVDPL